MRLRILSFTTVYPAPGDPGLGIFVRARVMEMARQAELKVVVPVALVNYGRWKAGLAWRGRAGGTRMDGAVEVLHPRWLYPPLAGFLNGLCLFLGSVWTVLRLRRRFPFDVIDSHFAQPDGVGAALLALCCRCPFTVTLRGDELMHSQYRLRRWWMQWALRRAGRVITVSGELRRLALSLGVRPERVVVIPNGVDRTVFYPRPREEARKRLGIPPGCGVIVSAGYLIERKGHHRVIEALAKLRGRGADARLYIVGGAGAGDHFEPKLRAMVTAQELGGAVQFTGRVAPDVLAGLFSAADVVCLASRREGWPNVVHEALACGTPVVASNTGAVPDLIPSERYGSVVPVGDVAALTDALQRALACSWDREAIAAWAHSRSWETVAGEALEALRQAVAGAKA